MNRKEKIESITQHEDRNKLDWDDNVLVQPEEGEGSGKNGTERKHFKMSLRKLAPDTDWSEPTDDTPPSGKLVKDSLEQIELTPGPQGDDGLSAYEIAVEEGFVGDETAWLASLKGADGDSAYDVAVSEGFSGTEQEWLESLKGADGDDGLSAYEIYVETTSDSPVKTEEQWLASLKGADGKSAYEYAEEEGYEGTEGEFGELLASLEDLPDFSKVEVTANKITSWEEYSPTSQTSDEYPSALLVRETTLIAKGFVTVGRERYSSKLDFDWDALIASQEAWASFWDFVILYGLKVKFLEGNFVVPSNIYYYMHGDDPAAIPCGGIELEGAGKYTVITTSYPQGGVVIFNIASKEGILRDFRVSNLKIKNALATTFGILAERAYDSVIENVIVEDMIGAGIIFAYDAKNVKIKGCKTINCGSALAGQQAVGIGVTETNSNIPSNIVIDSCTVIGGAYAGIGLVGAEDCKVVNCHVEDYGAIGAGATGGKRNIFANNTIIRDTQANPQSGEFGLLLNETDRAIVTGNIVENAHIMNNDSDDCVIENNIGDVL